MNIATSKLSSLFLGHLVCSNLLYDLDNATKFCHGNSIWDTYSDYKDCKELCPVDPYILGSGVNITWEDCTYRHDIADISEIIYYIGNIFEK